MNGGKKPTLLCKKASEPGVRKEIPKDMKLYKISTELSGAGYGCFQKWVKNIEATSEKEASDKMIDILERMKKEKNNALYYSPISVKEVSI